MLFQRAAGNFAIFCESKLFVGSHLALIASACVLRSNSYPAIRKGTFRVSGLQTCKVGRLCSKPRMNFFRDLRADLALSAFQVIAGLQIHPELRRSPEVPRQPECRVRRYGAAFAHDVVDARGRHLELQRQRMRAHIQGNKELFAQHFARMNGTHFICGAHFGLLNDNLRSQHQTRCLPRSENRRAIDR